MDIDEDGGSAEELDKIFIGEDKERYFKVGSQLPVSKKEELVKFLKDNIDVFAWTTYDVPGTDPEFICHHSNVSPDAVPRKQPLRRASQEHVEAVKEEVNKLKQAGAIKEIFYPEWLANTVVVKKKNEKWRVCVDFIDLNKEKTAFRAPNGNYHYRVMPFGLKNAGSTYQRLQYLANPPILSRPEKEEVLYAFLAVTDYAVSLVLVRNDDGIQKLVYYISKSLQEAERRYLPLEKALLAISDYTGRVAKWGTRLGAYDVKYMPRTAIKGQVLAAFVAEFTEGGIRQEDVMLAVMSIGPGSVLLWEVYTDGASNRKGAGIGIVLIIPEKLVMEKSLRLGFVATNNEAEYEALLASVQMVKHLGGEIIELYCDSRLIVGQVNGEFEARDERMKKYLNQVKGVLGMFKSFKVRQIPRGRNAHADSLAMLATSLGSKLPRTVMIEDLMTSSLTGIPAVGVQSIHIGLSWMDPIVTFLKHGMLPEDKVEAKKVRRSAPRYWLSKEHKLYKRSYSGPYLLCVHPEAVEPLLEKLHEGICGSHTGGRSLAHRAMTQGY
ncbi:uncharacterized protein LOC142626990 [Castanea sativa]|uniref:uncharacterized protein LOC142626990 n=1 Tax=Castanea sativa TaxID=21020 RepID=UPI003F64FA7E